MTDLLPLPIFPVDSASITLTTTVWVGVVVAVFYNLRFGWNLSAMVVPGYLVPLLLSRPTTAVVIFAEAIITYLLARLLSDVLKRLPWWSSFFGRDRFFIIVVISIIVRSTLDGWLLPAAGQYVVQTMGVSFDYRNELQSFGLIIVALVANYFWKPGLIRGFNPIVICIATAYVFIYFGLGSLTNLNLANFNLMYEDISVSLLASPKSYILLTCTAYLASWVNLRYAWDFNGILIPALLGMMLYSPLKIFASCAECALIYSLGSLLLQIPILNNLGMQGGRKLLFFFTVCFGIRLTYAHVIPLFMGATQVTDVFGLGYLLSTLMAVKAHEKRLLTRMIKGTLQVSLVGGVAGSLIGFILYSVPGSYLSNALLASNEQTNHDAVAFSQSESTIFDLVRQRKPQLYEKKEEGSYQPPSYAEMERFRSAMRAIKRLDSDFGPAEIATISEKLASVNYTLTVSRDRKLFLAEAQPSHGWGMYAIDPSNSQGLCLEVPTPLDEWATFESGISLMRAFSSYAIAIAGSGQHTNIDGTSDVTRFNATMFSEFHQIFGAQQTVQVRAMTGPLSRRINRRLDNRSESHFSQLASARDSSTQSESEIPTQVFIESSLPHSMPLQKLEALIGGFDVHWSQSPLDNQISKSAQYAELILTKAVRRRLLVMSLSQTPPLGAPLTIGSIEINSASVKPAAPTIVRQRLSEFLSAIKDNIHTQNSETFAPAKLEEMLFMDHEVVGPLIDLAGQTTPDTSYQPNDTTHPKWFNDNTVEKLNAIQAAAQIVGYRVSVLLDADNGDQFFVLHENNRQSKGWGTYIFRPSLMQDIAVEIPRPLFENRSFDFGAGLFTRPGGAAILIAGAHPLANADGSADISKAANRRNLFNLVRQVLFRKLGSRPFLLCQARAIQAPVDFDVVMASDQGETTMDELSPLKRWFAQKLQEDEFSVGFVDGSPKTAGYELGILMKAASIQVAQNKEIISLWLSPALRTKYRQQNEHSTLIAQMNACEIDVSIGNLVNELLMLPVPAIEDSSPTLNQELPERLRSSINSYVENFDIIKLLDIRQQHPDWTLNCFLDDISGQSYLSLTNRQGQLIAVVNLTGFIGTEVFAVKSIDSDAISQFVNSRKLWLEVQRR